MKHNDLCLSSGRLVGMTWLLAMFCLMCSMSAQATAPRINAELFGEEKKADIVGYQSLPVDANAKAVSALMVEIVTEAFNAEGKSLTVDMLPSSQLAKYALVNNDAVALIGVPGDLTTQESSQYRLATFYLKRKASGEEPVSLIFSKKNPRGDELHQAFNQGLQKIIKSGKYLEILKKYQIKAPADYEKRLRRYNPSLK